MRYLLPLIAALGLVFVGACSTSEEAAQTTASTGAAKPAPAKKEVKKKKLPPSGSPFTVYFKFDSTDMTEESHGAIFDILQKVGTYKPKAVEIIAHTDKPGTDEYNMKLSQKRADALADMVKGAGAKTVRTVAMGEKEPVVDTPKKNQTNRRAIISFLKK